MNKGWTVTGKFVLEDNSLSGRLAVARGYCVRTVVTLEMFVGYPMGTRDMACAEFGDLSSNIMGSKWHLTEILSAENSGS